MAQGVWTQKTITLINPRSFIKFVRVIIAGQHIFASKAGYENIKTDIPLARVQMVIGTHESITMKKISEIGVACNDTG